MARSFADASRMASSNSTSDSSGTCPSALKRSNCSWFRAVVHDVLDGAHRDLDDAEPLGLQPRLVLEPGIADDRRELAGGGGDHPHFVGAEPARVDRLHHHHTHQQSTVHHRRAEEGAVQVLVGLGEVLESRVAGGVGHDHRCQLLGGEADQPFVHAHAHATDARRLETDRRRQHEVAPVGVEEIDGADVAPELRLDGAGNVGESFGRIAAVRDDQAADFLQRAQQ
jgi:hypothetical protein